MAGRANATNSTGTGTTQTQAGNVTPINTWVTTFPRSGGFTITRVNGEMAAAGAATSDTLERDSDGGFWDSTVSVRVPCDYTSLQTGDDMKSY
jgi:hypothetical protein